MEIFALDAFVPRGGFPAPQSVVKKSNLHGLFVRAGRSRQTVRLDRPICLYEHSVDSGTVASSNVVSCSKVCCAMNQLMSGENGEKDGTVH